ncbi:MAG: sulfatase-like hydrolase/transferase [Candidatus Omnitrophica bacterium]|nr:sulfatase-like hydrolase/transferase [Candidatus Omnitrophota bacterium]
MRKRDLFWAAFGLVALFVQLPIVKMILDDPQTLHIGVWNNPTFLVFSVLTFLAIPIGLGIMLASLYSLYPKSCLLLMAMGISFMVAGQINFYYLHVYFLRAPWKRPLFAVLFLLLIVPLLRYRQQVIRVLKVSGLFGVAIFAFFAAEAAPSRLTMALPPAPDVLSLTHDTPTVFFLTSEKLVASYVADEDGRILADRLPNLARFVAEADYYPKAYANHTATAYSLKTLYSGRYWTRERKWVGYPTLVSILGAGRRTHIVTEMLPEYCRPPAVCERVVGQEGFTSRALLRGWYGTYLHSILPPYVQARLVRVIGPQGERALGLHAVNIVSQLWDVEIGSHVDVGLRQWERLRALVLADGQAPALYLAHNFMTYDSPVTTSVLRGDAPQSAAEYHEELEAARESLRPFDTALGEFLDQLRASGLYDRSLIFIGSDSGHDPFVRSVGSKGESLDTLTIHPDLVRIFLAIKRPGQRAGRVFAAPIQQVDVLPTILAHLGIDPAPFHFAGIPVTDPDQTWELSQRPLRFAITSAHSGILYYLLTDPHGTLRRVKRF